MQTSILMEAPLPTLLPTTIHHYLAIAALLVLLAVYNWTCVALQSLAPTPIHFLTFYLNHQPVTLLAWPIHAVNQRLRLLHV